MREPEEEVGTYCSISSEVARFIVSFALAIDFAITSFI